MNLSALKTPDYKLYMIGNAFGMNANWILRLVIGWLAWDLTQSSSFVGLISFMNYAPVLFGGPLFGVITDRSHLKSAALYVQSAVVALAILLLALSFLQLLTPLVLAVYSVAIGTVLSAYQPIRLALGPQLVPERDIASVISLGALNFNISRLTGPALAGVLITFTDIPTTLALAVLIYAPFLFILSKLNPRPRKKKPKKQAMWIAFKEGVAFVRKNTLVMKAFWVVLIFSATVRSALEVLPVFADGVFEKGAAGLGTLTAAAGAGALIASVIQVAVSPAQVGKLPIRSMIAVAIGSIGFIWLAYVNSWFLMIFLITVLGFASTIVGVNLQSSVQTELDDSIRGRVMSLWMSLAIGGTAIGALLLGALIDIIGLYYAIWLLGVISLLSFAVFIPSKHHNRPSR